MSPQTDTGNAIRSTLISPNEADSNSEPANVVDGLFAIARAIDLGLGLERAGHGHRDSWAGVELGAYDHRIALWLTTWEPQTIAVIASWITRASREGHHQ